MMRPHCDHCNSLIADGFQTWVQVSSPYDGEEKIYHIKIGRDDMFCKDCWINILLANIDELQGRMLPPAAQPTTDVVIADDDIPF